VSTVRHAEHVMGTVVSFEVRRSAPGVAVPAIERAVAWLRWVDSTFSPYRSESQISLLERGELTEAASHREVRYILSLCEQLRLATNGYFDARAAGHLDPSGVVKGWSVDRASELLTLAGCPDHLIDGGGDVRFHGRPAAGHDWQVGITHPVNLDGFCAVVHLT
jgi:thiamine biosynthesis lipoprotein